MKLKVVVDLDVFQRKFLQGKIGKSKGITPTDYKEALIQLISTHIFDERRKELLEKSA
jgi:hypothetical protein